MSADRVQTTPASIHDAISTQIPYRYRAEVNHLFWMLKQDAPVILDSAIVRGHAVASELAAMAQSQPTGLYTDAEPAACVKVAAYLNAAIDEARRRVSSSYPGSVTTDATSLSDRDAAYYAMVARDSDAWRDPAPQTTTRQADSSQPALLGDRDTEWQRMNERNANAWKARA